MSDFSDSDVDDADDLALSFTQATERVQQIHSTLAPSALLEFYGLYKQSTSGSCNTPKPGIFQMLARSKWSAWHDLGSMTSVEAQRQYIAKLQHLDKDWQIKSRDQFKPINSWVVHSIEMAPTEIQMPEHEKSSYDFVKEKNLQRLRATLQQNELHQLDENGMGLIHWATDRNAADILEYLLSVGADVNMRDAEQQTALHYATSCGHLDCLHILLKFEANSELQDAAGLTCIDIAENNDVRNCLQNNMNK